MAQSELELPKTKIRNILRQIEDIDTKLSMLGGNEADRERKIDYLQFAINEIESAELSDGEEEKLLERKKKLLNLEKITTALQESYDFLSGEGGVTDVLSDVSRKIASISQYGNDYEKISERLEFCLDEISDISALIGEDSEDSYDPEELEEIERRLEIIRSLKKKYGQTYADIISTLNSFRTELDLILKGAEQIEQLNAYRQRNVAELETLYSELTSVRKFVANKLERDLSVKLKELAMKSAVFKVEFTRLDGEVLSVKGRDQVRFLFNANRGEVLNPLDMVISGGELSRLMLAIKSITGGNFGAETFIFDEIDVGISGEAAQVVAENFAKIAKDRQIIAISHLPQIVAMADVGFLIYKREEGDRTVTHVKKLDKEGKINEVVRLVGGNLSGNTGFVHAEELINRADTFKNSI